MSDHDFADSERSFLRTLYPRGERHYDMTAAELKRKLRNSPFAPLSARISLGSA